MTEHITVEYDDNLNCPICLSIFVNPRIYNCGHSVCEECMYNNDKQAEEEVRSTFDLPNYKCPICRCETIIKYTERPLNRRLITLLDNIKNYSKVYTSKIEDFSVKKDINLYNNINFSHLAFKSKYLKCEKYYQDILPLLYKASREGKSKISIVSNTKDLQAVSSMLSKKLFKHGIYKVQALPNEFNIYILPENISHYQYEQINPDYNVSAPQHNNNFNLELEFNNIINNISSI